MREAKLLTGIAMLLCNVIFAQTDLSGKISDSKDGTPIVNATVKIRGGAATLTNAEGLFTLHNIAAGVTLEISSVTPAAMLCRVNNPSALVRVAAPPLIFTVAFTMGVPSFESLILPERSV